MMNEYRAISPSRNDQWSGNTLRSPNRPILLTPTRSSAQVRAPGWDFGFVAGASWASTEGDVSTTLVGLAITGLHP